MIQPPRLDPDPKPAVQLSLEGLGAELLEGSGFESEPSDSEPERETADGYPD